MTDYPSWVKPHLRQRLEQERLEKSTQNKHPEAKTSPTPGVGMTSRVVAGARVRVAKPLDPDENPGWWCVDMDVFHNAVLTVDYVVEVDNTFTTLEAPDWWFNVNWVVEII